MTFFNAALILTLTTVLLCSLVNGRGVTSKNRLVSSNSGAYDFESTYRITSPSSMASIFKPNVKKTPMTSDLTSASEIKNTRASSTEVTGLADTRISRPTRFNCTTLKLDTFLTYSDGSLKYLAMSLPRNDFQTGPSSTISKTHQIPGKTIASMTSTPGFSTSAAILMSDFTQGNKEFVFTNEPTADTGTPAELKTPTTTSKQFENITVERDVLQTNSILPIVNQSILSIKSNFWTKLATATAKKLSVTEKITSFSRTHPSSLLSTFIQSKGNPDNNNPTTEIFAPLASLSEVDDLQTPLVSTTTPTDKTRFTMSTILPTSLANETSFTISENFSSWPFNSYTLGPALSQINTTSTTENPRVLTTKHSLLTNIFFTPVVENSESENISTSSETKSDTSTTRQRPTETKFSLTKGVAYSITNHTANTTNSMNDRLSTVRTTEISMRPFANDTTIVDDTSNSYVVKTNTSTVYADFTVTKPSTAFEARTVENLKAISYPTATDTNTVKYLTEAKQTVSSSDIKNSKKSFPSSKVTNIFTMMPALPNTQVLSISNDTENMSTQKSEKPTTTYSSTMHSVTSTPVKTAQQPHDTENTEMTRLREMTTDSMKATTDFLPTTSTFPAPSLIQTTETPSQTSNMSYIPVDNTNTTTISITPFKATRSVPSITFVVANTTFSPVVHNKTMTIEHPTSSGRTNSTPVAVTRVFYDRNTPIFITTKSDLISTITSETSDHESSTFKVNNSITSERTFTLSSLDPLTVSRPFPKPTGKDNITTQFATNTTTMFPRSSSIFSHSFSTNINFTGNIDAINIATTISSDGKISHSQSEVATNISISSLVPSTTSRSLDFVTTVSKLKTTKQTTSEVDSYSALSNISSPSSTKKTQTSVLTSHSTRKHIVHSTDTYNSTLSTPQTVKNPANTDSPSVSSAKAAFSSTNTLTRNSVTAMDDKVTYEPTTITATTNSLNSFDTSTKTEANYKTTHTYFTKSISNSTGFQTFWSGKVSRTITSTTKTNVPRETSTVLTASSNQNKSSFTNAAINSKKTTKLGQTIDSTGLRVSNSSLVSKPPFTATVNSTVFPYTQTVKQNFHVKSSTISTTTSSETKKYSRATTTVVKPSERSEVDVSTQTTTPLSTLDISSSSNIRSVKPSISIFNSVTNTRIATVHAKASSRADTLEALTTLSDLLSTDNDNNSAENISKAVYTVSTTMPHVTTKVYPDFSQLASDVHFAGSTPPITGNVENFTRSSSHNASTRKRDLEIGVSGLFRQNSTSIVVFTSIACLSVLIPGMIFYKTKAYKKNIQPDRYGNICPKRLDTNSRPIFHRDVLDFNITTLTKTPPPMKDFKDTPPIWPPKENTPLVFTSLKLYHRPPPHGKISIKNFLKTRVVPTDIV